MNWFALGVALILLSVGVFFAVHRDQPGVKCSPPTAAYIHGGSVKELTKCENENVR